MREHLDRVFQLRNHPSGFFLKRRSSPSSDFFAADLRLELGQVKSKVLLLLPTLDALLKHFPAPPGNLSMQQINVKK
jgi:hypothetical protein